MTDKVVKLPVRKKPEGKFLKIASPIGACQHKHTTVDEKLAELKCDDCGERLNPIKFLAMMAGQLTRWDFEYQRIVKARAELDKRCRTTCQHCGKMTRISR